MLFRPDRAPRFGLPARRPNGFNLVEAILAAFMLLTAVLMSVSVFDSSLQAEASNESRIVAAIVAESAMAEIRQAANINLGDVTGNYDGLRWTLPEYPTFEIVAAVGPAELAVPCTVLETQYNRAAVFPAPTGRYLGSSCLKVDITVSWSSGRNQSITITEQVASFAAAGDFALDIILPSGGTANSSTVVAVAKDGIEDFDVRASSGGQEIHDIQFSWHVQALTGFGSIYTVSRDGKNCQYQNAYRNFDDKVKYSPGVCYLVVTASYQGRQAEAKVMIENAP
jgi:hypothetical protein